MSVPAEDLCGDNNKKLLVVGKVPFGDQDNLPEFVFMGNGTNEALHFRINISGKFLERWGNFEGKEKQRQGEPGDGTTIDFDEPFIVT